MTWNEAMTSTSLAFSTLRTHEKLFSLEPVKSSSWLGITPHAYFMYKSIYNSIILHTGDLNYQTFTIF